MEPWNSPSGTWLRFQIPPILDLIAIILFAITGALSAARRGYDWIGAMSIALVTGCGGGLMRDILLNVRPVFLEHEAYIWAVLAAVLLSIYVFPARLANALDLSRG